MKTHPDGIAELFQCSNASGGRATFMCSLFRRLPVFVTLQSDTGDTFFINEILEETTGYSLQDLRGKGWWDLLFSGKDPRFILGHLVMYSRRTPVVYETPITTRDGSELCILWVCCIIRDPDSSRNVLAWFGIDISQRKQLEENLSRSEELFRKLSEISFEGVVVHDGTALLHVNRQFIDMFGYSREELGSIRNPQVFFTPESWLKVVRYFGAASQHPFEVQAVKKDGTVFPIRVSGRSISFQNRTIRIISAQDLTDIKKTEDLLRHERDIMSKLMRISPIGIVTFNREGHITFANDQAEKILEMPRKEILKHSLDDPSWKITDWQGNRVPGKEEIFEGLTEAGDIIIDFRSAITLPTGRQLYAMINVAPLFDSNNEVDGIIAIFEDITRRIQEEQELRESEERFRLLSGVSFEGVAVYSDNQVQAVNQAYIDMFGYTLDELRKMDTVTELHAPSSREKVLNHLIAGYEEPYEAEGRRKNGQVFPIQIHTKTVEYRNQKVMVVTVRDLTRQKQAEAALHQEREFLNKLIETSPTGILIFNKDGKITFANNHAEKLLGLKKDAITQLSYNDPNWKVKNCEGKLLAEEEMSFYRARATQEPIFGDCLTLEWPDGRHVLVSFNVAPLCDSKNSFEGAIATFEDITSRIQTEKHLEELNRHLEEHAHRLAQSNADLEHFAFIASHDLKEPLNVILGYAHLLEERYGRSLDEEARYFIKTIKEDVQRMQRLITGLLQIARISTQGRPFEPVDFNEALSYALNNLQGEIRKTGAEIKSDSLPTLMADEIQISQVFQNLIGNALKYSRIGPPHIEITAKRKENVWEFSVKDDGIGIESKNIHQLFKLFQRFHKGREETGTGIGLVLSEKIVHRHGGNMRVESEFGIGSTFYFTIPV